jgi:hypothetical protein
MPKKDKKDIFRSSVKSSTLMRENLFNESPKEREKRE